MNVDFTMHDLEPEIILVHSAKKFRKLYKKYSGNEFDRDLTQYDGMHTTGSFCGKLVTLVYLRPDKKRPFVEDIAILVHEATHVKQFLMERWGEEHPGKEHEALLMEYLSKSLISAHIKWMTKKVDKEKKSDEQQG